MLFVFIFLCIICDRHVVYDFMSFVIKRLWKGNKMTVKVLKTTSILHTLRIKQACKNKKKKVIELDSISWWLRN